MERISVSDVRILENIYLIPKKVEVYKVQHIRTGRTFCMKKLYVDNQYQLKDITFEYLNLASLNHPNLITLRSVDTVCDNNSRVEYISIFTDFYNEGDLSNYILKRKKSNRPFSDDEIIDLASQIVESLAYLQEKDIAHRDIKPENIFMEAGKYIVGDFGSLLLKDNFNGRTLVGTPLYLSPILRRNYDQSSNLVMHNVYKSDVYSLGMTILYMATFCDMNNIFKNQNRQNLINLAINQIRSSSIKELLLKMLDYEEDSRFDFIQTKHFLARFKPSICLLCEKKNMISKFYIAGGVCGECSNSYEIILGQKVKVQKDHESQICVGNFNPTVKGCEIKTCIICKNSDHPGTSCLSQIKSLTSSKSYICPCSSKATLSPNSYFIHCQNSHLTCIVCSQFYNSSDHEICVFLFTNVEIPNLT